MLKQVSRLNTSSTSSISEAEEEPIVQSRRSGGRAKISEGRSQGVFNSPTDSRQKGKERHALSLRRPRTTLKNPVAQHSSDEESDKPRRLTRIKGTPRTPIQDKQSSPITPVTVDSDEDSDPIVPVSSIRRARTQSNSSRTPKSGKSESSSAVPNRRQYLAVITEYIFLDCAYDMLWQSREHDHQNAFVLPNVGVST